MKLNSRNQKLLELSYEHLKQNYPDTWLLLQTDLINNLKNLSEKSYAARIDAYDAYSVNLSEPEMISILNSSQLDYYLNYYNCY